VIAEDELADLSSSLQTFVRNAIAFVNEQQRGRLALTPRSWTERATDFRDVAGFAQGETARHLGGDLAAEDLAKTGVASLLGSQEGFDVPQLSRELARCAARGDCSSIIHIALDVDGLPEGPTPIAGWELVRYTREQVRALAPIPTAAHHQAWLGWNPTSAALTWWLRRDEGIQERTRGSVFHVTDDP
jgi:hypothetical protein